MLHPLLHEQIVECLTKCRNSNEVPYIFQLVSDSYFRFEAQLERLKHMHVLTIPAEEYITTRIRKLTVIIITPAGDGCHCGL